MNPNTIDRTNTTPAFGRTLCWLGALLGCTLVMFTESAAAERWETLQAIHWVENPHNQQAPGPCGELGAYQFRRETWRMYSLQPFAAALDRRCSDEVAVRHYEWIKSGLVRHGLRPTIYNIAMAWNAGLSAVVKDRAPASSRDYAARVSNLAADLRSRLASNR
ncbi:MAG: hypothetical protein EXS39_03475 [Opitutaceae bacterium]|nr:hypothetical protein [Opitutaceae bacterium]